MQRESTIGLVLEVFLRLIWASAPKKWSFENSKTSTLTRHAGRSSGLLRRTPVQRAKNFGIRYRGFMNKFGGNNKYFKERKKHIVLIDLDYQKSKERRLSFKSIQIGE